MIQSHLSFDFYSFVQSASAAIMIDTMTPNSPKALPKISTISIFMKVPFYYASTKAAEAPIYPTHKPQARLTNPAVTPAPQTAYAFFLVWWNISYLSCSSILPPFHFQPPGLPDNKMETITP